MVEYIQYYHSEVSKIFFFKERIALRNILSIYLKNLKRFS